MPSTTRTDTSGRTLISEICAARGALYDEFSQLSDTEWHSASLCEGWTIADVAAHLAVSTRASFVEVGKLMVAARGGFDAAMDVGAKRYRNRTQAEVIDELVKQRDRVHPLPVLGYKSPMVDIIAHTIDSLAPLGRSFPVSETTWRTTLSCAEDRFLRAFFRFKLRPGVRLLATDCGWSFGPADGRIVEATSAAMIAALTCRDVLRVDGSAGELAEAVG